MKHFNVCDPDSLWGSMKMKHFDGCDSDSDSLWGSTEMKHFSERNTSPGGMDIDSLDFGGGESGLSSGDGEEDKSAAVSSTRRSVRLERKKRAKDKENDAKVIYIPLLYIHIFCILSSHQTSVPFISYYYTFRMEVGIRKIEMVC